MTKVEIKYADRSETVDAGGKITAVNIPYIVFEVKSELDALSAVEPEEISGLIVESKSIDERISEDAWSVTVSYKEDPDWEDPSGGGNDEPDTSISFNVGSGGTIHLSHALKTIKKWPSSAPDFDGAINWNGKTIDGIDVEVPGATITKTIKVKVKDFSVNDVRTWTKLVGKVNDSAFLGFDAGELLFLGATTEVKGDKKSGHILISFTFSFSPNDSSTVSGYEVAKKGWEYVWVKSRRTTEGDKYVKPEAEGVYLVQIHHEASFSGLGIES